MSEKLRETQRRIQRALLHADVNVESLVPGDERMSASERLAIYRNAYQARLMEAMSADFPVLHAYIGDESFSGLVKDYVRFFPSHSFSLRWLGQYLCEFLEKNAPYCEHEDLRELARFEWALCHAFDAADSELVTASTLGRLAPELWPALTLEFHASMRIIALRGNTVDLWRELKAQKTPPVFDLHSSSTPWLIWRQDLKILYRPLESVESGALDLFMRGESFESVCERLAALIDEQRVPAFAAGCLARWIGEGLVIRASPD